MPPLVSIRFDIATFASFLFEQTNELVCIRRSTRSTIVGNDFGESNTTFLFVLLFVVIQLRIGKRPRLHLVQYSDRRSRTGVASSNSRAFLLFVAKRLHCRALFSRTSLHVVMPGSTGPGEHVPTVAGVEVETHVETASASFRRFCCVRPQWGRRRLLLTSGVLVDDPRLHDSVLSLSIRLQREQYRHSSGSRCRSSEDSRQYPRCIVKGKIGASCFVSDWDWMMRVQEPHLQPTLQQRRPFRVAFYRPSLEGTR